jgi:hypothetical protein
VALLTKSLQPAAVQCSDPFFRRQVLWSDLAERWGKLKSLNDRRLMDNVLQFMKENDMGPWDALVAAEIQAPVHFQDLEKKLQNLADEIHRRVIADPFARVPDVTRRSPFTTGGYKGVAWAAPKEETISNASYWYFLGFAYGRRADWAIERQNEGEVETLVFLGMWPGRDKIEGLRDAMRKSCGSLLAAGFELQHSKDMRGLAIVRRRSLQDFLNEADQRTAIVNFVLECHQQVASSGAPASTYNSFVTIVGNERPAEST